MIRVFLIMVHNLWSQWNANSLAARWPNKCGAMQLALFDIILPNKVTLVLGNHFWCCNVSLISPFPNHGSHLVVLGSSGGVAFHRLFGSNEMIWFLMQINVQWTKPTKWCGILYFTMVGLSGNKLSMIWKKPWSVAYDDVLRELDST